MKFPLFSSPIKSNTLLIFFCSTLILSFPSYAESDPQSNLRGIVSSASQDQIDQAVINQLKMLEEDKLKELLPHTGKKVILDPESDVIPPEIAVNTPPESPLSAISVEDLAPKSQKDEKKKRIVAIDKKDQTVKDEDEGNETASKDSNEKKKPDNGKKKPRKLVKIEDSPKEPDQSEKSEPKTASKAEADKPKTASKAKADKPKTASKAKADKPKTASKAKVDKPKTASKAKVDKPKTASKAKADKPKTATNPMNERDKELSDKELNDLLRSVALRLNTPIRPAPRQKAQPTTKSSSSKPGPAKIVNTRNNKKKDDKESNKKKQSNSNRPASPPSSGWIYLGQIVDNQWVSKTLNIENGRFPQSGNTYLIDATSVNVRRLPTRKDPNNEPFHWFKQGAKVTVLGYKSGHSKHYWVEIKMQ